MNKNQAVIDYLLNCKVIKDSPLYLNLVNAKDGAKQLLTLPNDKNIQKPYIDGSVEKRYQLTIIDYRKITSNAIVKVQGVENENIVALDDVQQLIDWIKEQNDMQSFPDFGEDCMIDSISTTTDNPRLDMIDVSVNPPLARYSFTVTIDYLDTSKKMWE